MSWKFWKKRPDIKFVFEAPPVMQSPIIPMSTLFRWYCYDLEVVNPNKIASKVGLNGISEEVEEMEKAASDLRMVLIEPLVPFLKSIAQINSLVVSHFQTEMLKEKFGLSDDSIEDAADNMRDMLAQISLSALISGFSSALALHIVEPTNLTTKEIDHEQL